MSTGISDVLSLIIQTIHLLNAGLMENPNAIMVHVLNRADAIIAFILGIALFFGAAGLSRLWQLVRGRPLAAQASSARHRASGTDP